MRYLALATDYDGTIATHGIVDDDTLAALERLRCSGRKLIMVTGRELSELKTVFPHLEMFDWVVSENGAQLYRPSDQENIVLADPPSPRFVAELQTRGVAPLSVGDVIVATWHPHETTVLETIRDLGLELQVIFNKDAVMVLPSNVNKATGLNAALARMGLSAHDVVGVGDAENDHAFLSMCECSAAVDNALPAVKQRADIVLARNHGAGVTDLIDRMLKDDLQEMESQVARHQLLLGTRRDGQEISVKPYDNNILIAGPSGSGKSTVAASLLERLMEHKYQFCIIDPEGDYAGLADAVVLGSGSQPPVGDEVLQVLAKPDRNVVVNLVGVPLADRPAFFMTLMSRIMELRSKVGRPHWLIVDEAHHLLPTAWLPAAATMPQAFNRMILITVHPESVSPAIMALMKMLIVVGAKPEETVAEFCRATNEQPPELNLGEREEREVLAWSRESRTTFFVKPATSRIERRRHIRKYAEGELTPERSFYFRGPHDKLKLRAQNLMLFMQLADGVDDETWDFHLRRGDFGRWFATSIKDPAMAEEAQAIERQVDLSPLDSRQKIKELIEARYTLPASSFMPMPDTDAKPKHGGK